MGARQAVWRSGATPHVWFDIGVHGDAPVIETLEQSADVESFDSFFDDGDAEQLPSCIFYVWFKAGQANEPGVRQRLASQIEQAVAQAEAA